MAAAVSGGSDSMALWGLLLACRERLGIARVGVIHVDHGLRGEESCRERCMVEEAAGRLGCAFHGRIVGGRALGEAGIEAWAREERYRFFAEIRRREGYRWVATGHTAEDQAETVLLRLLRGTGIGGLRGIRPVRDDGIVRPVLSLHRGELRGWLEGAGWRWCTDSSNTDTRFRRNWVRHVLLARLAADSPDTIDRLEECAEAARGLDEALAPWVNKWLGRFVFPQSEGGVLLKKPFDPFPAREAVATLWRRMGIACDRTHLDTFLRDTEKTHGEYLLPGGWRYYPMREGVEIRHGVGEQPRDTGRVLTAPGSVAVENGERFTVSFHRRHECRPVYDASNRTAWLDRDTTGDRLVYRRIGGEDRFVPLGGRKAVGVLRYLKKRGVVKRARERAGVVTGAGGAIVWLPGVAVDERFRIRETTRRLVRISCRNTT